MAKPRTAHEISASEFKARCLGLLDEIAASGVPLVITKRGRPLAQLVPIDEEAPWSLLGSVSYETEEDLLAPVGDNWDAGS